MIDRREEILLQEFNKYKNLHPADNWASWDSIKSDGTSEITFNSMDGYMKEMCLLFAEFIVHETSGKAVDGNGNVEFKYNGEWVTKEQLFENFL